jgi:hypothetical protein
VTISRAAAAALVSRILAASNAGARRQCIYSLAGYDAWLDDRSGFVKLFGVMRDLRSGPRPRPAGVAMSLLNRAVGGRQYAVRVDGAGASTVTAAAFEAADGWRAVMTNASAADQVVSLQLPAGSGSARPSQALTLTGDPESTNEDAALVVIQQQPFDVDRQEVAVPAYGVVVLLPEGSRE